MDDSSILHKLALQQNLRDSEWQQLVSQTLQDQFHAVFGMTPETAATELKVRSQLFSQLFPQINTLPALASLPETLRLRYLWQLWLPLAQQIAQNRQKLGQPLLQGILGGQGTGKTTLAAVLVHLLPAFGYSAVSFSLDDLYKTYAERQQLKQFDPRLVWRGPPGTHDIDLGRQIFDQFKQGKPIEIPQFDKSLWQGAGDRISPHPPQQADILLFEGWFVGIRPLEAFPAFSPQLPPPIFSLEDWQFAQDCHQRLFEYLPLWEPLDQLMVLLPVDYRLSLTWRKQAEQQMISTGKSGMSDAEITQFVEYFQKALHPELLLIPLCQNPQWVDLVLQINADHAPHKLFAPTSAKT